MEPNKPFFKLSLAQWSLHKTIQSGQFHKLDFALKAKDLGFDAVEYVSRFYMEESKNTTAFTALLKEMKSRSNDSGVHNLLIMVDGEGALASDNKNEREAAVNNHKKWVDAVATLGGHSLRVYLLGNDSNEQHWLESSAESLSQLAMYAKTNDLNIIVENHGGLSSNGALVAKLMHNINLPNVGTLPDFGNFCIRRQGGLKWPSPCIETYDRYLGVAEMMPFAKGVSAKSYDFDTTGNETTIDYSRMLHIINQSGFNGYIGVEYEGQRLTETEGILATKELLTNTALSL
nr:sugar phosphate isomerase/epimerase family protein [uncultured Flavobacterium sp.]